jgi:hypothetical protein
MNQYKHGKDKGLNGIKVDKLLATIKSAYSKTPLFQIIYAYVEKSWKLI